MGAARVAKRSWEHGVDSVSYVAEREGRYVLPAVELLWWNVSSQRLERASADSVEARPLSRNPDLAPEFALPPR